jgi:UDP-glucose 4-epimerase
MKILVVGGAGFIGSNIVDRYIKQGHEVIIVDNLSTGKKENINNKAVFYNCDIRNSSDLEKIFQNHKIDIINHHAAQMEVAKSVLEPVYDSDVNINGGINLLEAAVKNNIKKIIYSSSGGAVYGDPKDLPCTEESPIKPVSHYGVSKYAFEEYIKLYNRLYDLDYTIWRYPNIYGPRQNPYGEAGVNAIFIVKMFLGETPIIYGDGSCERDYLFVEDVVEANVIGLEKGSCGVYNLGLGEGIPVSKVYETIAFKLGFLEQPKYMPLRKGEVWKTYLKSDKIFKEIGWLAKFSFDLGIDKTIEWFKEK